MVKPISPSWFRPIATLLIPRGETLWYFFALLSVLSLLGQELTRCSALAAAADFEGFGDEGEEEDHSDIPEISDLPFRSTVPPPPVTKSDFETHHGPPNSATSSPSPASSDPSPKAFDYWDEEEFEGLPITEPSQTPQETTTTSSPAEDPEPTIPPQKPRSYTIEIVCISFLTCFAINYFTGKRENENIALAWAAKFATKDSIFDKNFSLLGTGDGTDTPLLLKEGPNVFKFYASGRRYCQGMLATMELQSRHDLISRIYNLIVPCKDEISFEVYMNDDAMDHVVFALAKKKVAKVMQKEVRDLQRYASLVSPLSNRKWVVEDFAVISESREVAGDLITETVLDQVFGDKAFEKFGKGFMLMHFSDQHSGTYRKMLYFKFALPDAKHMADMTRLVALVPYYIDLIGRYKVSSQVRSKTEAARSKVAQEIYKEHLNARQEALQKRKAEKKKIEEAEVKLSGEALRKKEAKERARQMKKAMPKVKMTRAH
ncbi:uncharacterized protein At5g49945-like [Telopea speciosissima]|uniref:uncharacterized protein At5g49945-like n=1 Tax=Telopea speciosissima TaxID=54955 RepID=UPI001CC7C886|nr:uncharacterized protein At5g49945-like [Telopea speciosissima]XP_043712561.1 uncharacterized protein At5g49945-like [Telopea speciosissima]